MAKRTDLKKILVIGSGPIVIGQAAEFDYAGTQACLALKEEGYEVVLCRYIYLVLTRIIRLQMKAIWIFILLLKMMWQIFRQRRRKPIKQFGE